MSTLTSRGAAAVKIYEEAVQCRSAAAVIQSSPKTSGGVFTSGSCTRSQKHTMTHNNLNYFTHFPLICQQSLPQTGEDSLSTFFLICNLNQLCRTSLSKTGIFLKISHVTAAEISNTLNNLEVQACFQLSVCVKSGVLNQLHHVFEL